MNKIRIIVIILLVIELSAIVANSLTIIDIGVSIKYEIEPNISENYVPSQYAQHLYRTIGVLNFNILIHSIMLIFLISQLFFIRKIKFKNKE